MRKLIYSLVALGLSTSVAMADSSSARMTKKSLYVNSFTVLYPWGVCRTRYVSRVSLPWMIRGYACGTYVVCLKTYRNKYRCAW